MNIDNVKLLQHERIEERADGTYIVADYDVLNVFTGSFEPSISIARPLTQRTLWQRLRARIHRGLTR